MSQALRSVALGALLLGLGSAAGWQLRGASSTRSRELHPAGTGVPGQHEASPVPRERVIVQAVDSAGIREAVRQAIGEELAAARGADEADSEAASAPTPEALVAIDSGKLYIDEAIGRGRWSTEQASHVRELGTGLSGDEYQELVRPLVIAINEGRVQVDAEGPPF